MRYQLNDANDPHEDRRRESGDLHPVDLQKARFQFYFILLEVFGLLIIAGTVIWFASQSDRTTVAQAADSREQLIAAIDAFHDKNKSYPASLEELSPAYITRIPISPGVDQNWIYEHSGDGFRLSYNDGSKDGHVACYDSNQRGWHVELQRKKGRSWSIKFGRD